MAKLNIYYLFTTALVLLPSRRRKKKKRRRGRHFWMRPYQSLVLKLKEIERQKKFWVSSHVT